jgi:hypothetical protein
MQPRRPRALLLRTGRGAEKRQATSAAPRGSPRQAARQGRSVAARLGARLAG